MADFKTHVTFSSAIGAGYAVVSKGMGYDLETALVAGGLCGAAGMLPDVDSDSGIPRRETLGFAAAIVPMLMVDRFKQFDLEHDQIVLIAAGMYYAIRFVGAKLIGRWSVHRGMWHSIPAVLIFAGLAFLISGPNDTPDAIYVRYLKACAVGLGAMSHLLLDEIYSVDTRGVVPRFKKSFGSAIKLWGKKPWANFTTYAKLVIVVVAIFMDANFLERLEQRNPELANKARQVKSRLAHGRERIAHLPENNFGGAAAPDSSTASQHAGAAVQGLQDNVQGFQSQFQNGYRQLQENVQGFHAGRGSTELNRPRFAPVGIPTGDGGGWGFTPNSSAARDPNQRY